MNRKIFGIAVLSLFFDQLSKILVSIFLGLGEELILISHFFSFHFVENYGAAWSILSGRVDFLIIASIVALFIIYRYMNNFQSNKRNNLAFGFILGGIFGNLIDRIFLGYVRDFLSFKIFTYNYPVFNLADSFIVVGVILLMIAVFKGEDKNARV